MSVMACEIYRFESFDRHFSIVVDPDFSCSVREFHEVLGETRGYGFRFFDVGKGMDAQISLNYASVIGGVVGYLDCLVALACRGGKDSE